MSGQAGCRRPISPTETLHLLAMGQVIRDARDEMGITQAQLAAAAHLSLKTIKRLETGKRRTRSSTLYRLAAALTPHPMPLHERLLHAAGPALAPESPHSDLITRRRERRHRQTA